MHKRHVFWISVVLACVLLFTCAGIWVAHIRIFTAIDFERVCEKDYKPTKNFSTHLWFTLRSPEYSGFFPEESLDTLGVDYNDIPFDYNRYTYIITIGHELLDIKYSRSDMKNRIYGIFGKQYVGHVTLKEETTDKVYIYRIPKMDIDCDYHEPQRAVTFVSG